MNPEIVKAQTESDIRSCRNVILELRPHLADKDIWALYQQQLAENFRILYIPGEAEAAAFIGYRIQHMLYSGKTLYIDDLCTLPAHRGKGYARLLLDRIAEIARAEECDTVSLDSGHQRYDAHRLYLNQGFDIIAHHFQYTLKDRL